MASICRWYVPPALGAETAKTTQHPGAGPARSALLAAVLAAVLAIAALALAACGGGDERQDVAEPSGKYPVEVNRARFAARQRLAETSDLRLAIENAGDETVPDLAVTIWTDDEKAGGPFGIRIDQPEAADPTRPVWILEHQYPKLLRPGVKLSELDGEPTAGAEAAQTATFSFGAVEPGESKDVVWRVTPVRAGTYTVHYEIAAGLQGKAKAVTRDGSPVEGEFVVTITDEPPRARVDDEGNVVTED